MNDWLGFFVVSTCALAVAQVFDGSQKKILSRQKRYLIFPEGSNVQLVYCLTIGDIADHEDLVMGLTTALAWELPNKVDPKIAKTIHRHSRSVLFPKIEAFLQSLGVDGRSCVLRAICEASKRPKFDAHRRTIVQEVLHSIFKLKHDGQRFARSEHQVYDLAHQTTANCSEEYSTCPLSIYELDF